MLTKKQSWRRAKAPSSRRHEFPSNLPTEVEKSLIEQPDTLNSIFHSVASPAITRNSSLADVHSLKSGSRSSLFSHGSFAISEIGSPSIDQNHPKTVIFSNTVRVCLVPSRTCLGPYIQDLFWSQDDYKTFKDEAINEIRNILLSRQRAGNSCTAKEVKQALYQPTPERSKSILIPTVVDSGKENVNNNSTSDRIGIEPLRSKIGLSKDLKPFPSLDTAQNILNRPILRDQDLSTPDLQHDVIGESELEWVELDEGEYPEPLPAESQDLYEDTPVRLNMRRVDSVQLFKQQHSSLSTMSSLSQAISSSLTSSHSSSAGVFIAQNTFSNSQSLGPEVPSLLHSRAHPRWRFKKKSNQNNLELPSPNLNQHTHLASPQGLQSDMHSLNDTPIGLQHHHHHHQAKFPERSSLNRVQMDLAGGIAARSICIFMNEDAY